MNTIIDTFLWLLGYHQYVPCCYCRTKFYKKVNVQDIWPMYCSFNCIMNQYADDSMKPTQSEQ